MRLPLALTPTIRPDSVETASTRTWRPTGTNDHEDLRQSPLLLSCPAFSFVPADVLGVGRALKGPPFPFEIGSSEGFRVDTPFTAGLAGALLSERRTATN